MDFITSLTGLEQALQIYNKLTGLEQALQV